MLCPRRTKHCFLLSLGICTAVYIYLKANIQLYFTAHPKSESSRPFPQYCRPFMPRQGAPWQMRDCLSENYFTTKKPNCSRIAEELHFITAPLSREEEEYPLAFIITIHKELELFMRLLRAIYAPQNVYCIHVDGKASQQYITIVRQLASCFPNVFLATTREKVTYAGFSRLKADLNCMEDLARSSIPWKKVINLCGQDFPVMSNLELVRYLQSKPWNGTNMTPGVKQPSPMKYRTQIQYEEINHSYMAPKGKTYTKGSPPHNLDIYFGTAYYALTRPFVDFVLRSTVAKDLLEWSRDTYSPDEHYWVTLNHLKDVPGSHTRGKWEGNIRAIKWKDQEGTTHKGCKGQYVRDICVFGLADLPWVTAKNSMFANKFERRLFPEAVDCLELWHRQKVLQQADVLIQPEWHLATSKVSNQTLTEPATVDGRG
ncbi:beta-1,3-galactosyl-O-glycosyl-glycoprotein beta-1,6-N-acetylglucosaminyltransferase 7-like [Brienomyrus brachyistius]|uniref:beta-1,3-galactosyl-O-glycosyl-glycoprotein beta-1,6-N-acetylglucosaminyltransferase 7-like n=1 Tax=Brienomyrus brachyistius TaxID=42636 RepID=UPI0020B36018|nr:beta-1,3-galactosyl-O-glycosyl-glycoprotein beta-1,6-N-acetylglucosaminyltransferase 7-like [Brienomyrus brachyistius]XP_048877762.1 beta-1,3-galactosyl-O-glycosyl-glycoprotein beta-1,6-N-acetylglucosaminyltransferase 7-like [Brienomyrus brachyistius]